MYAPHVSRARPRRAAAAHALVHLPVLIFAALSLCVILALDSVGGTRAAVGAMVVAGAGFAAYRLVRTSVRSSARNAATTPNRSARWYALGIAIVGASGVLPVAGALAGLSDVDVADGLIAGALGAGIAFLQALLSMPTAAATAAVRLGRALDGASVGLCLMFSCWVLMIAPHGRIDSLNFWIAIFACCVLSTAVIVAARPTTRRLGPALCAGGVCGAVLGLLGLTFSLTDHLSAGWLVAAGVLLVASAVLVWLGSLCDTPAPGSGEASVAGRASVLLVPAVMAIVIALDRLLTGGAFDPAEMMLGTLAAVAVGLRQTVVARAVPAPVQLPPTAEPQAPQEAFHLAYVDPLTGLANREQLTLAVAGMRAAPRCGGALLVIGMGGAREAPDDEALRTAAGRLRRCCVPADGGAGDLPARLSETELAVLTAADLPQAYGLAYRVVAAFAESQACVGICDLAGASSSADVLRQASLALSRAREAGPGRVEWYDPEVEKAVRRRAAVEAELPEALRRGQLDLIYQPIVDLAEDRPQAVEALLRWRHPRLGTLLPADVIPVAEQIGLIGDVGRWVLGQASAQLATWRGEGRDVSMAINVSPRGLDAAELVTDITAALARHRLPPSSLSFEFAESAIDESEYLSDSLAALRATGVRTALDAFGTGTASLAHLRRLPIDTVKLGRSFFDAAGDPAASSVLDVMVGMGRRLGVDVVAHGVELPADLQAVRDAHCRFGQGNIFAPPQPVERIEAYLDRFSVAS